MDIGRKSEERIQRKIAEGHYASVDAVLEAALDLLDEYDDIRQRVALGTEQLDRGESIPADEVFALLRERIATYRQK